MYVNSLYWVVTTFSTVGYGDFSPKTRTEIWLAIVVELVGLVFFAYLMGAVSSIVTQSNYVEEEKSASNNELENWMLLLNKSRPDMRFDYEL